MDTHGSKWLKIAGVTDRVKLTVFYGTLARDFLPIQLFFKRKHLMLPTLYIASLVTCYTFTKPLVNEGNNGAILYIKCIIILYIQLVRDSNGDESLLAFIIMDKFKA